MMLFSFLSSRLVLRHAQVLRAHFSNSTYSTEKRYKLVGFGNPLLDLTLFDCQSLLGKYELSPDNQILAEPRHRELFKEAVAPPLTPIVSPGGATQNTIRTAQWILGEPGITGFVGAIGNDAEGEILKRVAAECEMHVAYQVHQGQNTGICVALINGEERSLVTDLGAAVNFDANIHEDPVISSFLREAKIIYVGGYLWSSNPHTVVDVAQYASEHNVPFAMNLHAQFLCSYFASTKYDIVQYIDYLFGNANEALTFAQCLSKSHFPFAADFQSFLREKDPTTDVILEIAYKIAHLPKQNHSSPGRVVMFTNGRNPLVYCDSRKEPQLGSAEVNPVEPPLLRDTNGCGDAFVGGFLAQVLKGQSLQRAISCGIYASRTIAMTYGCTFSGFPNF